jgi:hypothetical protein
VLSGIDQGRTRRAANDARRRSGSSKADMQSVLDEVQYRFDDGATGLFFFWKALGFKPGVLV